MKFMNICLAALTAGSFLLSSCGSSDRTRYKMTVEVETPQGLVSGYAVREIVVTTPPNIPMFGEDRGGAKVRGEAVIVDLPGGQTLFALLSSANGRFDYAGRLELWPTMPEHYGLDPEQKADWVLPMLVTFRNVNDPTSIEKVDPTDLADSFGEGVKLKRIAVEVTVDEVTTGIEKRLSWLPNYYGQQFSGDRYQALENKHKGLSAFITAGAFSAGLGLNDKRKSK